MVRKKWSRVKFQYQNRNFLYKLCYVRRATPKILTFERAQKLARKNENLVNKFCSKPNHQYKVTETKIFRFN